MQRRRALAFLAALVLGTLLVPSMAGQGTSTNSPYLVYVGTYTGPASKGIYAFRFDPTSGKSTSLGLMAESENPSFLAIDHAGKYLYAVNEVDNYKGEKSGGVSAFAIDRKTGKLTFLNEVSSHGAGPCHVTLDKSGKFVLVANYDGGSVAVFPVLADGKLGEASSVIQHTGHGPNAERQEAPHAHEIQVTPDNRFAMVADLGLDELLVYRFDSSKGTLTAADPQFGKADPGAGPRHFVLHSSGKFVYVLNEMGGSITGFSYDANKGVLGKLQSISSLPPDFKGHNDSAEIVTDASGRFLYASNRGPDTVAVFSVDSATGALKLVEHVPTKGKTPRNFALDPTGKFLWVENQESNSVVIFRADPSTGRLTDTGTVLEAPSPVSLVFLSVE